MQNLISAFARETASLKARKAEDSGETVRSSSMGRENVSFQTP
jgi:hypothetical protein